MYNRELQLIDNEDKAYLLGLFYADGSLGTAQVQSRISLSIKDKDLILHLKAIFPFFHIHYDRITKIELGCYLKKFEEDLINNGCLPRKSFENRYDLHLPDISYELLRHFIRGYFDGDGGCSLTYSSNKQQKRVYIYSASINLLNEIKLFLDNEEINSSIDEGNGDNILVYKLTITVSSYNGFYNLLYNSTTLYLDRKKDLFSKILATPFFIKKEVIPCNFCSSVDIVCDGYYYYKIKKQRYLCKTCKRHFTAPNSSNIISGEDELLES